MLLPGDLAAATDSTVLQVSLSLANVRQEQMGTNERQEVAEPPLPLSHPPKPEWRLLGKADVPRYILAKIRPTKVATRTSGKIHL